MASSTDSSGPKPATRPELKIVERTTAGATSEPAAPLAESTPDSADPASAPASPLSDPRPGSSPPAVAPSRLPWLLGIALAISVILGLWQGQRADRLAAEVDRLGVELESVGAELAAYRAHLDVVRAGVDELASQASALSAVAHADPSAPAAEAGPEGAPNEASEPSRDDGGASIGEPAPSTDASQPGGVDF